MFERIVVMPERWRRRFAINLRVLILLVLIAGATHRVKVNRVQV